MARACVTVFGGTGFLGRQVVARLLEHGVTVRVAARHPERGGLPADAAGSPVPLRTDLRDDDAVMRALDGAEGAVNAAGLYVERGSATFRAIHVEGAGRVADACRRHGIRRLVHISGIGADSASPSGYVRARGEGEAAVRAAFDGAVVFRPSVMFGPGDAFLTTLVGLARRLPVLPLFGRGTTRLQPVFVGDVAAAAATALMQEPAPAPLYELGGPEVRSYRAWLETVLRANGRQRLLIPVPFAVWGGLAAAARLLPAPPLTEGQVALLARDNVASPGLPGLPELGITSTPVSAVLDEMLRPS